MAMCSVIYAQPGGPPNPCATPNPPAWCFSGGGPCAGPNPPAWCGSINVPIDQHVIWLALAGLVYGLYVLKRRQVKI